MTNKLTNAITSIYSLCLAVIGFILIFIAGTFDSTFFKVDIDNLIANIGALFLIIGTLQWIFDNHVKATFFAEIREEIIGNRRISESGISDFFSDSKDVDFSDAFKNSEKVVIAVNYSAKLIDNSVSLLSERSKLKKKTIVLTVLPKSRSADFLSHQFQATNIDGSIEKIKDIIKDFNTEENLIELIHVDKLLHYAFVAFDRKIWIIPSTNGLGRRAVPGFFVRAESRWFEHYQNDIDLLMVEARKCANK